MALRTNNHKVLDKIRLYIREIYMGVETDFNEICRDIYDVFAIEKLRGDNRYEARRISSQDLFMEWLQGLPSIIDTSDYYLHKCCIGIVAEWLEEPMEVACEYTESQAEELISKLIMREVYRGRERSIIKNADRYMYS